MFVHQMDFAIYISHQEEPLKVCIIFPPDGFLSLHFSLGRATVCIYDLSSCTSAISTQLTLLSALVCLWSLMMQDVNSFHRLVVFLGVAELHDMLTDSRVRWYAGPADGPEPLHRVTMRYTDTDNSIVRPKQHMDIMITWRMKIVW